MNKWVYVNSLVTKAHNKTCQSKTPSQKLFLLFIYIPVPNRTNITSFTPLKEQLKKTNDAEQH